MPSTLFELGPITIRAFGLMMATGFLCAGYAAFRLARGTHRNLDYLSNLVVWMMLAGVIGARLAYVAEHWSAEFANCYADILRVDQGGLMFYGGVAGAALALFLFVRQRHEPFLALSDLLLAVLPLGHAFGRMGCFLNGCCHGRISSHALAISYPPHTPPGSSNSTNIRLRPTPFVACRYSPPSCLRPAPTSCSSSCSTTSTDATPVSTA
jgi:phosphatidylglycerol:prolipoprotein diacylglycerol transferase